jgi:hypothetical protein
MTSRSIVLGTAALLLMSAATPFQIGFAPTAAVAQEVSRWKPPWPAIRTEFKPQLRERIQVLRDAIRTGAEGRPAGRAAENQAYREVLAASRRAPGGEAGQEADSRQGERTQRQEQQQTGVAGRAARRDQQSERQAKQPGAAKASARPKSQAEKAAREAERQAEAAAREAERPRQAEKAERKAQRRQSGGSRRNSHSPTPKPA